MTNEGCIFDAKVTPEGMNFDCNTLTLHLPRPAVKYGDLGIKPSFGAYTSLTWHGLPKPTVPSPTSPTFLSCLSANQPHVLAASPFGSPLTLTADAYADKLTLQRYQGLRFQAASKQDTDGSTPWSNADVGPVYRALPGGTKPYPGGNGYKRSTTAETPFGPSLAKWVCPVVRLAE